MQKSTVNLKRLICRDMELSTLPEHKTYPITGFLMISIFFNFTKILHATYTATYSFVWMFIIQPGFDTVKARHNVYICADV